VPSSSATPGESAEESKDELLLFQARGPQLLQGSDTEDWYGGIDLLDRRPDGGEQPFDTAQGRPGGVAAAPHDKVHRAVEEFVHGPVECRAGAGADALTAHVGNHANHGESIASDLQAVDLAADRIGIGRTVALRTTPRGRWSGGPHRATSRRGCDRAASGICMAPK